MPTLRMKRSTSSRVEMRQQALLGQDAIEQVAVDQHPDRAGDHISDRQERDVESTDHQEHDDRQAKERRQDESAHEDRSRAREYGQDVGEHRVGRLQGSEHDQDHDRSDQQRHTHPPRQRFHIGPLRRLGQQPATQAHA